MKKYIDYLILFLLSIIFVMVFKYSTLVKTSILGSLSLWVKSLIPSMLPIYIVVDLLINYGLLNFSYRLFKNNAFVLLIISLVAGTPTNAKYIKEFVEEGYITSETANFLLMFSYSPNPLFILAFAPSLEAALFILGSIYLTNFFIFLIFKPQFSLKSAPLKTKKKSSFIDCLTASIAKSADILILILGVVAVYGVLNTFIAVYHLDSIFISSLLELTNALSIISNEGFPLMWATFACLFGGLSIHTQIKSILEGTDIEYRYFLIGRLCASIPFLILACLDR